METNRKTHILAVASGGGHWVQLLRILPAFDSHNVTYMTTNTGYQKDVKSRIVAVTDANLDEKLRLVKLFAQVLWHLLKIRPDIVISTGAAPGFAAILFGRLVGAHTIWIDSIANSEELSKSGQYAKYVSHLWLTQWPHLAKAEGPQYWGAIL